MKVVTSAQMRDLEAASAALGLPGPALMEIAGRALFAWNEVGTQLPLPAGEGWGEG
jgi:NAD(P)H-hydrate repair Nnr-like enzyme with NAD(P)H-hydrate epimerase domain